MVKTYGTSPGINVSAGSPVLNFNSNFYNTDIVKRAFLDEQKWEKRPRCESLNLTGKLISMMDQVPGTKGVSSENLRYAFGDDFRRFFFICEEMYQKIMYARTSLSHKYNTYRDDLDSLSDQTIDEILMSSQVDHESDLDKKTNRINFEKYPPQAWKTWEKPVTSEEREAWSLMKDVRYNLAGIPEVPRLDAHEYENALCQYEKSIAMLSSHWIGFAHLIERTISRMRQINRVISQKLSMSKDAMDWHRIAKVRSRESEIRELKNDLVDREVVDRANEVF